MKKSTMFMLRRAQLALQEFGPLMALVNLPGGYLIALTGLTGWIYRRWPQMFTSVQE
jgi:hypothetical protein